MVHTEHHRPHPAGAESYRHSSRPEAKDALATFRRDSTADQLKSLVDLQAIGKEKLAYRLLDELDLDRIHAEAGDLSPDELYTLYMFVREAQQQRWKEQQLESSELPPNTTYDNKLTAILEALHPKLIARGRIRRSDKPGNGAHHCIDRTAA